MLLQYLSAYHYEGHGGAVEPVEPLCSSQVVT